MDFILGRTTFWDKIEWPGVVVRAIHRGYSRAREPVSKLAPLCLESEAIMPQEATRQKGGPGKSYRKGITVIELMRMFPDEESARKWFEDILWPDGIRYCPRCESYNTHECSHAKMPYRCRDCRKYFSVKTETVMANSPTPLQKWLFAIYLDVTSLKGVSSMKLHRDLGIT